MSRREHWQTVYANKDTDQHSWYQSVPSVSLDLVSETRLTSEKRVLDVGGGASVLIDLLLDRGFTRPGVLDVSENALEASRARLGQAADQVEWIVGDVLDFQPDHPWDLWHDRAVFHFLVDQEDRASYRDALLRAVPVGGHVIVATFGPDGPERCSGLEVFRCSASEIARELGAGVELLESRTEEHMTPQGRAQNFEYARLVRV
jgi:SAM-dependent methyltransferase